MVVLNFYGKIQKTCISQKLKLYLSNLPSEPTDDWQSFLSLELNIAQTIEKLYMSDLGTSLPSGIVKLYSDVFSSKKQPTKFKKKHYNALSRNMIHLQFDYDYSDMPCGSWDTNCFDSRLCEKDYIEKLINFMNFASHCDAELSISFPKPVPQWTYSSNYYEIDYHRIFWGSSNTSTYVNSLTEWGLLLDSFLQTKNDYLLLDYLINAIFQDNEHNETHLLKSYSLCQLFLENKYESELDIKLVPFLQHSFIPAENQKQCASLLRKLRNKLAHGDFIAFENLVEEYATNLLDSHFDFDYSEYSRKNWVITDACCLLDNILRQLIYLLLYDRDKLKALKNGEPTSKE